MKPVIQVATPAHAPIASDLIYMTMGSMADYLFGFGNPKAAQHLLERLFSAKKNRFSYQLSEVAIVSDKVVGLLLAYPAHQLDSLQFPILAQIIKETSFLSLVRFLYRSLPLWSFHEAQVDEYFVCSVSVLPEYHGQGVGSFLMTHAEKNAREEGLKKISLTVDVDNKRASALYTRLGYKIVETIEFVALKRRIGYGGIHRMVKTF